MYVIGWRCPEQGRVEGASREKTRGQGGWNLQGVGDGSWGMWMPDHVEVGSRHWEDEVLVAWPLGMCAPE